MSRWERAKRLAAQDPQMREAMLATLEEAKRRIQQANPAPSSTMTFRGGKVRSVNLIRKMGEEVQ